MPAVRWTFRRDTQFEGTINVDLICQEISDGFTVKGMFFGAPLKHLGSAYEDLVPLLRTPPAQRRYLPFRDYPQADYTRVVIAAATHTYPRLSTREALRRFARQDFESFASSTLGKVTLAVVRDARDAFMKLPSVYSRVAKGPFGLRAEEVGDQVHLWLQERPGDWSYQIGQFEGITDHYGDRVEFTVEEVGRRVDFWVRWL